MTPHGRRCYALAMGAVKSSSIATTLATAMAIAFSMYNGRGVKAEAKSEVVDRLRPVVDSHARDIESLREDIYRLRRESRELREDVAMVSRVARENFGGALSVPSSGRSVNFRRRTLRAKSEPHPRVEYEDEGPMPPPARLSAEP